MKQIDPAKYEEAIDMMVKAKEESVLSFALIIITDTGAHISFGGKEPQVTRAAGDLLNAHITTSYLPQQIADAVEADAAKEQFVEGLRALREGLEGATEDALPTPASLNSVQ